MNSYAEENYLKVIYKLSENKKKRIVTKSIAEMISTKPSSVTDMIKKLAVKRLLKYEKYHGVKLTVKGEVIAKDVLRKHRLWEEFLSQYLGFRWDEVHIIAEELEHINSDLLIEKLDRFLNYPKFDPHGNPIPDSKGVFPLTESINLSELIKGDSGTVVGMVSKTPSFLNYLNETGIHVGSEIEVIQQVKFDSSVEILVNQKKKNHLSQKASENILIRRK
jgi:DtxR family Mn-dependent transcriptional regulator